MKKKLLTPKRLLSVIAPLAMSLIMLPATGMEVKAAEISNPRIVEDSSMEAGQKVTWDCVYFGYYPQTEIVSDKSQCGTVGKDFGTNGDYVEDQLLYRDLVSATYDNNGDTTIDGVKYRRIKKDEATCTDSTDSYYNWSYSPGYHYFRYEKIKWRVLSTDGDTALLLSDLALDAQKYNTDYTDVTWETSTIRNWLNGYSSPSYTYGTSCSSKNFIDSAFGSADQAAINSTTVINDNISGFVDAGNNTKDKLFLLSVSEAYYSDTAKCYGFVKSWEVSDEAKRCKSSTYAKAMGTKNGTVASALGNCSWWLRTPGYGANYASDILEDGSISEEGCTNVDYGGCGVRVALNLNLSSADQYKLYSYAGTACSDGSYEYIRTPKKVKIKKFIVGRRKLTIKLPYKPNERGATKYQIAYRQKGSSKWKKITTSSKTKTITKLKKGKRYYVKIRAYKTGLHGKRYSAWSKSILSKKIK